MKLLTLMLFALLNTGASAAECGHWLTGKLLAHVANRRDSRNHNLITAMAAPDPLWASNGFLLRWNVITNVPKYDRGWTAEGIRQFLVKAGKRGEVIPAHDPDAALHAIRSITLNPKIESELIFTVVDFTDAALGSWLTQEYEAMWFELYERREEFTPEDEDSPRALLLPIVLLPDDLDTLPRREGDRFQFRRPNVQQTFGFHRFEKFLK